MIPMLQPDPLLVLLPGGTALHRSTCHRVTNWEPNQIAGPSPVIYEPRRPEYLRPEGDAIRLLIESRRKSGRKVKACAICMPDVPLVLLTLAQRPPRQHDVASPETQNRVLAHLMNEARGGRVAASYRDIAAALDIGRETARRAVLMWVERGEITILRPGTGNDYPTLWSVPEVVAS